MKVFNRWTRSAAVLAAIVPLAAAATSASAAPVRTATTTDYKTADYLKDVLGLSSAETNPAIEPVTYDHFQWLLQQPGNYAVLVGDPATDARFAARAQDVEAAADAANVERVFWFNPNLSGNARIGDVTQPNLDIRNPAGITSLTPASRTTYGYAWLNLVSRYLGNGVDTTVLASGADSTRITATTRTAAVNDAGATAGQSTEVGDADGGALYDYSATDQPADVSDSYFFVYNKDRRTPGDQPLRIVSWVNLSDQADSPGARADVATAIGTVGGANLAEPDQFAWWKSATNARQVQASGNPHQGAGVPVLTDADDADEWRIEQITYPQLVHLLESDKTLSRNAVVFFGGTWCTNTRPVLPAINRYAQQNDVHVFNFDTVLDGAAVGGGATSGSNPLQSRNAVTASGGVSNNPSFIYGELFDHYLGNAVTQYAANNRVTYYREGRESNGLVSTQRLQVPYLIGYQGNAGTAPHGGVTRQWISDNGDGTYREFMSNWWLVNPQPNQLGISTIPLTAPIWARVNAQLATFSWRTDIAEVVPNTGTDADAADFLVDADTATVTYTDTSGPRITITSGGSVGISPAALTGALAALGAAAPENLAAARAALIAANQAATPDATLIGRLSTVAGAWGVAQIRKNTLTTAWTNVAFGQKAVRAAEVFFGGLPGGVVSTQTVTADAVKQGTAPTISITIANEYGRVPAGQVSLVVKQGGATVASDAKAVTNDAASFTLPALAAGTYDYTLSYAGDDQIAAFTKTGSLTVTPPDQVPVVRDPETRQPVVEQPPVVRRPVVRRVKPGKVTGKVAKAPTRKKAGSYKVTIASPKGGAKTTGKVKITIKKGKVTKTVTGRLVRGAVTLKVPKLAKGTWKVTISWAGDSRYRAASAAGGAIKVTR